MKNSLKLKPQLFFKNLEVPPHLFYSVLVQALRIYILSFNYLPIILNRNYTIPLAHHNFNICSLIVFQISSLLKP